MYKTCVGFFFIIRVDQLWIRDLSHTTITATFLTTFLVSEMIYLCVLLARSHQHTDYLSLCLYTDADGPAPLELPNQWLWDIIDEFIYQVESVFRLLPLETTANVLTMMVFLLQFQSFSQYRCKTAKKTEEEIEFLRNNPKIWNVHSVLNVLHSLVDKSNINRQLEVYTSGGMQKYYEEIYQYHSRLNTWHQRQY